MPEPRTVEQVRTEIEAERLLLTDDIAALRAETRAALPYALGGVAALALLTRGRGAWRVFRLLRVVALVGVSRRAARRRSARRAHRR